MLVLTKARENSRESVSSLKNKYPSEKNFSKAKINYNWAFFFYRSYFGAYCISLKIFGIFLDSFIISFQKFDGTSENQSASRNRRILQSRLHEQVEAVPPNELAFNFRLLFPNFHSTSKTAFCGSTADGLLYRMEGNVWLNWQWYVLDTHFVHTLKVLSFEEIGSYLDHGVPRSRSTFRIANVNYAERVFVVAWDIKCRRVCAGAGRIVL